MAVFLRFQHAGIMPCTVANYKRGQIAFVCFKNITIR